MPGETVTAVSQRLLAHRGGLRGLGNAEAVWLEAALELRHRFTEGDANDLAAAWAHAETFVEIAD